MRRNGLHDEKEEREETGGVDDVDETSSIVPRKINTKAYDHARLQATYAHFFLFFSYSLGVQPWCYFAPNGQKKKHCSVPVELNNKLSFLSTIVIDPRRRSCFPHVRHEKRV